MENTALTPNRNFPIIDLFTQRPELLAPRYWPSWAALGLLRLIGWLPYRIQLWIGRRLGDLVRPFVANRKRVVARNLELCFPGKSKRERNRILRDHFRALGMGVIEMGLCWWQPDWRLRPLIEIEGLEHLHRARARGKGVILLSGHFTTLELGARLIMVHVPITAMYRRNKNPFLDHFIRTGRERHTDGRSISRDDVRGFIKALQAGRVIWYAPDQSSLTPFSAPTPFFGHPAQTPQVTGRLARMSGAAVVPFFAFRRPDGKGYHLQVEPELENFPSGDAARDAARVNAIIEQAARRAPEQYLWVHKRFKKVPGWNAYPGL